MVVAKADGVTVGAPEDGVAADAKSTTALDWNTRDARGSGRSSRVQLKT